MIWNCIIIGCICGLIDIFTSHRLSHKSFWTLPPTITIIITVVTVSRWSPADYKKNQGERYDHNNRWPPYTVCVTRIHTYSGYKLCGQRCADANYVFSPIVHHFNHHYPSIHSTGKKTRITWVFKTHDQNNNNNNKRY